MNIPHNNRRVTFYKLAWSHYEGLIYYGKYEWPSYSFWHVPVFDYGWSTL